MNTTKTTYNQDYDEYKVRLFVDGVYQSGADYFTNDKQDARDTAKRMIADGGISDKTTDFAINEQKDFDEENDFIMYDVCNDYSLDEITTEFKSEDYKTENVRGGVVYRHKENKEIHYFKGKKGLSGKHLF
jgi:hypothetical protein